jgi:hypothetical protein
MAVSNGADLMGPSPPSAAPASQHGQRGLASLAADGPAGASPRAKGLGVARPAGCGREALACSSSTYIEEEQLELGCWKIKKNLDKGRDASSKGNTAVQLRPCPRVCPAMP